jgi:hypothetical protein
MRLASTNPSKNRMGQICPKYTQQTTVWDIVVLFILLERVSKMSPEGDPEAGEVKEGVVDGEKMLMTNQQAAKLSEPRIGSFQDPSAFISAELSAIFIAPSLVVLPVRRNQFNTALFEALAQRIGVVAAVSYDALQFLPRAAF